MRGLDDATAEEILAVAIERHHPSLVLACSFQKEESVLVDELVRLAPDARIVTIDTGVLFPETLATWRAFEDAARDLAMPVEFGLATMNEFIDWTKKIPFQVQRGEGECAV